LKGKSPEKEQIIRERKQQAEECGLFNGVPIEFKNYFEHIRSDKKLDYSYLLRLFRNLFRRKGFEYDCVFDWTELKFLEYLDREINEPEDA
jgi:casein kinase 1/casein kinase I family protein HRR25